MAEPRRFVHGVLACLALSVGCARSGPPESQGVDSALSCAGEPESACQGSGCCAAPEVPTQDFTLGGSVEMPTSRATVSAFLLDQLEVTAGRFRKFVDAYDAWHSQGNPKPGAGAHPLIAGSGWQPEWPAPESATALVAAVECGSEYQTYDGSDPELPMNCVSWFEAFLFCAWDARRLPTEAEWESAAVGGDEERLYPWGSEEPQPSLSVYDCTGDQSPPGECAPTDLLKVGSRPDGAGRFGHRDLAGSVWEWVLDWYASYPPASKDAANVETSTYRVIRGSGWYSSAEDLRSAIRYSVMPDTRRGEFGFRCAGN